MISDKHECIFVHVPKTGGQSVETVFLELNGLDWSTRGELLMRSNPDPARGPVRLAHLTAREYVDCEYVGEERFKRYFKFSFVRNPWDRLVSAYRYLGLDGRQEFRAFVSDSLAAIHDHSEIARVMTPQIDFLTDPAGNIVVDFVGRFETLGDDFGVVSRTLDLGEIALPHRNAESLTSSSRLRRWLGARRRSDKAERRPYQHYYDDELRERVAEFYSADIDRLGYSFDGSFAREPIV